MKSKVKKRICVFLFLNVYDNKFVVSIVENVILKAHNVVSMVKDLAIKGHKPSLLHIVPFCEGPNEKPEGFANQKQSAIFAM